MLVRDTRRARKEELRNQAMAKMVPLLHRDALPGNTNSDERVAFEEKITLALLQLPDEVRRKRIQDSIDLVAHGAHDARYLQDFTRRSTYEITYLARTDLRLCLAHRNQKSMPAPDPALREEVRHFRDYESYRPGHRASGDGTAAPRVMAPCCSARAPCCLGPSSFRKRADQVRGPMHRNTARAMTAARGPSSAHRAERARRHTPGAK